MAIITGTNAPETLTGTKDNDVITGLQGNDLALMGAGNDTFIWNPGDGSDTVDGGTGNDTLQFNGSNVNEIMTLDANGGHAVLCLRLYARPPGAMSFALTARQAASSSEKMASSQKVASLLACRPLPSLAEADTFALMSAGSVEESNSSRTNARTG